MVCEWDEQVPFLPGSKKYKILVRLLCEVAPLQFKLVDGGQWGPQSIFCIKHKCDIESIDECSLESL